MQPAVTLSNVRVRDYGQIQAQPGKVPIICPVPFSPPHFHPAVPECRELAVSRLRYLGGAMAMAMAMVA